jgi:ketosteroid isomerase-like protein
MTDIAHDLAALERQWMEAVKLNDFAALEQILGDEYVYTATGQGRWSRQGWLDTVAVYDLHSIEYTELDVREYGDVAVVIASANLSATVAGEPRNGTVLLTDTWVRRDGRWQVVARSSVLAPSPGANAS